VARHNPKQQHICSLLFYLIGFCLTPSYFFM
jgi:hypothetical protein